VAGQFLEAARRTDALGLEAVLAGDSGFGDAVVPDVLSYSFAGVEFG
jgi:hypothetical protein